MLAVTALVVSLGLADSLNPVTILVALYLASTRESRPRLAGFVTGVFAVYLLGGLVLLLGPGALIRNAVDGVELPAGDLLMLTAGAVVIGAGAVLWAWRRRWTRARLPERALHPGSALALGAVVTALDLATAFPYFGAIGVISGSGASLAAQLLLLVVFNVLYVLPLVLILAAHVVFGDRCESVLARVTAPSSATRRRW